MNNFDNQMQELISIIKEMLNNYSDEELQERGPAIINNFNNALSSPDTVLAVKEVIKEIDLQGYTPEQVIEELGLAREAIYQSITELKAKYPNSPVKQEMCDMFASSVEAYLMNFIGVLANRDGVNIGIELAHPNAKIPTYAHEGDQGADIYAVEDMIIPPHSYGILVPTGIKMLIPHDWAVSIRPRSGLSKNSTLRISNAPATIDQQYRGEIKVLMDNIGDAPVAIKTGERIAQMILERNYQASYHRVESVSPDTERGEGGFGSSGN